MRAKPGPTYDTMEEQLHAKPRILVVDDDLGLRRFLTEALRRRYNVDTLPTGIQLAEVLNGNLPDLIILDVMLPWLNGFELCKTIKTNPQWKHIPVLFLTGKRSNEDFAMGLKMGADGYLTKPFSMKELSENVQELLSGAGTV